MIDILGNYDCGELIMITNDNVIVIRDGSYQGPDYWGYFFWQWLIYHVTLSLELLKMFFFFWGRGSPEANPGIGITWYNHWTHGIVPAIWKFSWDLQCFSFLFFCWLIYHFDNTWDTVGMYILVRNQPHCQLGNPRTISTEVLVKKNINQRLLDM